MGERLHSDGQLMASLASTFALCVEIGVMLADLLHIQRISGGKV